MGGITENPPGAHGSLGVVFSRKRIDAETLEELEEALILADLGTQTTRKFSRK
jgi:signal recognition particle GTPase